MDVEAVERAEAERRLSPTDANAIEDLWKRSERAHHARRRAAEQHRLLRLAQVVVRATERGVEEAPGMRVYQPGEEVLPEETRPATRRKYARGSGPLDSPPNPPVRLVGRRRIELRGGGGGSYGRL